MEEDWERTGEDANVSRSMGDTCAAAAADPFIEAGTH